MFSTLLDKGDGMMRRRKSSQNDYSFLDKSKHNFLFANTHPEPISSPEMYTRLMTYVEETVEKGNEILYPRPLNAMTPDGVYVCLSSSGSSSGEYALDSNITDELDAVLARLKALAAFKDAEKARKEEESKATPEENPVSPPKETSKAEKRKASSSTDAPKKKKKKKNKDVKASGIVSRLTGLELEDPLSCKLIFHKFLIFFFYFLPDE